MAKKLRFASINGASFTVDDGKNPAVTLRNGVAVTSEEEGGWLRDIVQGKVPGRSIKNLEVTELDAETEEKPKSGKPATK